MINYVKSEWLRLLLIGMYLVVIIHCAIVGNVLALIGWGTGALILLIASIYSWYFHKITATYKSEAKSKPDVVINIK